MTNESSMKRWRPYLLGLTVNSMTGWDVNYIILVISMITIFYTIIGGLEAVIWTDALQGIMIWLGAFIALGYLLFTPTGGIVAVFGMAASNHKFSLGSPRFDLSKPTVWVLMFYGFFYYLQRYVADQTVVQR